MKAASSFIIAAALIVLGLLLPGHHQCVASTLPLDCKLTGATYTTRQVQLNSTAETVTLSVFRGTSFYVDCFAFVVANDAGVCKSATVESWALTTSVNTRREKSRHPLTGDLLGPSVISTSYYYDAPRYIYLQLQATSMPTGCDSVVVAYSFSAYTSTTTPPINSGATAAPFLASLSPNVVIMSTPTSLYFELDKSEDTAVDRTYQIGYTSLIRVGGCQKVTSSSGTTSYITSNGTNVPGLPGVGKLINNLNYLKWDISFSVPSYVMLCIRPTSSATFNYFGLLNVYPTNPAFTQITSLAPGAGISLNTPYVLTFVGLGFDLKTDSAKFASLLSLMCSLGRAAGGVPEAIGTLTPTNAVNSPVAYWNFTISIPGAYFVCYKRGSSWVAVPPFIEIVVNSRLLVTNVANALDPANAPAILYRSITRTITLAPPPTTAAPPTMAPPTLAPGESTTSLAPITLTLAPSTLEPTTANPITTTTAPIATTTQAPSSDSSSDSSGSSAECTSQLDLPSTCPLLANTAANTLHLILTVKFRVATFNATSWRTNLSHVLCIPRSSVAVYEMSDVEGSNSLAYLVIGLLCTPSTGALPICSAANLLSTVYCLGGTGELASGTTNATLNATYTAQRELLRSPMLGIVDAQDASSGISTANTTNHAAPSDNPVLSPSDVAIVSSTIVIAVCASVGAVVLAILVKKRKFVRQQLGRLNPGEVFRRAIVVRVARTTDMDDL
ncbi:Golgi/lysosome glycoprotein, putative, partial [Bodo saltans]